MAIRTSIATPTANSYISVASANTYFTGRFNSDPWNDISSSTTNTTAVRQEKENLLIQAAREIDNTYRFNGSKYNQGIEGDSDFQNLQFPRANDVDNDSDPFIKENIQFAALEQALWIRERATERKTEEGTLIDRAFIGKQTYLYLKPYITRTVPSSGNWPWQKSNF
jgi:hypothetical protein